MGRYYDYKPSLQLSGDSKVKLGNKLELPTHDLCYCDLAELRSFVQLATSIREFSDHENLISSGPHKHPVNARIAHDIIRP